MLNLAPDWAEPRCLNQSQITKWSCFFPFESMPSTAMDFFYLQMCALWGAEMKLTDKKSPRVQGCRATKGNKSVAPHCKEDGKMTDTIKKKKKMDQKLCSCCANAFKLMLFEKRCPVNAVVIVVVQWNVIMWKENWNSTKHFYTNCKAKNKYFKVYITSKLSIFILFASFWA